MNAEESNKSQNDFQKIFDDLENQAKSLFPNLYEEIKTFNDSHIVNENYQQYINSLNQLPSSVSSNHVS
jgi:hypothetical protein